MTALFKRYFQSVMGSGKPIKFIVSRFLWHSGLCRFFKIRCRYGALRFFPTALSASMWINSLDRHDDELFFQAYLQKDDIVIDVGANIGTTALASANMVGPKGKVFAFEPHPRIFRFLNANIRLNGHTNIETFNVALGDRGNILTLSNNYSDDQNRIEMKQSSKHLLKIRVKRLDDVLGDNLKGVDRIALLKIDVEGFEKFVIDGTPEILSRCGCVYFESCDDHFSQYGYSTDDLLKILTSYGFSIYKIKKAKLQPIAPPYRSVACENLVAFNTN